MPRVRIGGINATYRDELVAILKEELSRKDGGNGQPLIYEQAVPPTDTLHVTVVWERWSEVPTEQRSAIILDAYEQVDPDSAKNVTLAMGVTTDEGIQLGLLPYQVIPVRKQEDPVSSEKMKQAMLKEGAVETPTGLHLRFPTLELAEKAFRTLSEKIPGPYWAIAQEVTRVSA